MIKYWGGQSSKTTATKTVDPAPEIPIEFSANSSQFVEIDNDTPTVSNVNKNDKKGTTVSKTAAQDEIVKKIGEIDRDLVWLFQRKQMVILTDEQENDLRAKKIESRIAIGFEKIKRCSRKATEISYGKKKNASRSL